MKCHLLLLCSLAIAAQAADLRIGLVGCDTSHATAFTQILNDPAAKNHVAGAKVIAAFKQSSPDIESSHSRVDEYEKQLKEKWGVKFYDSIEAMCADVDAVILSSVDGRTHLPQVRPVLAAKKPVFIDKPIAANLRDALEIARLTKESGVPVWTGSSYRWYATMVELKAAKVGEVRGAISYGPAHLEKTHTDLTWYGVHPTEALYTVMGQGCESVTRTKTPDTDVVVGQWSNGRTGTLVGLRTKSLPHQVTVFGSTGFAQQKPTTHDYAPLVAEIIKFFQTGKAPVPMEETIEMFAFMEAADASAKKGGAPVKLAEVLTQAK
jgi:predicted dehydrogenase